MLALKASVEVFNLNLIHRRTDHSVMAVFESVWLAWIDDEDVVFFLILILLQQLILVPLDILIEVSVEAQQIFKVFDHCDFLKGRFEIIGNRLLCLSTSRDELVFGLVYLVKNAN